MQRLPFLFVLLAGCQEYNLSGEEGTPEQPVSEDREPVPVDSEPPADSPPCKDSDPPEEECNGVDDDGDGLVDEGFGDVDGDGLADCLDDDCEVEIPAGGSVETVEACGSVAPAVVKDPWNLVIERRYDTTNATGIVVMPAVGNLTDDDGDGDVDRNDIPDIAFTVWYTSTLVALHGDGSGVIFQLPGSYSGLGGVSIADVDVDGEPEVIARTIGDEVVAVDGSGTTKWISSSFSFRSYAQPAVADLDADGEVEVIMDTAVLRGVDGSTAFTLSGLASCWRTPVAADIDADGTQEIILGENVYSHTGSLEWSSPASGQGNFAAVADIDGDAGGEVFFVTGTKMYLHDDDGTLLNTTTIHGCDPGPPAVADFDGDGAVEIAFATDTVISVWEADGTMNWFAASDDSSGFAGCSGYDMDGDGAHELLYADQDVFYVFDGASGAVLYQHDEHDSATLYEYPVVADVDGDGSAEIVVASSLWYDSGALHGFTIFGHANSGWAPSGPTWGTHDFAVTNLNPDGSVPSPAPTPWSVHNAFRARPAKDDTSTPDLFPILGEVCVAS